MYPWFATVTDDKKPDSSSGARQSSGNGKTTEEDTVHKSLKDLNLRLRRLVHQSISDLIDPSRYVILFFFLVLLLFSVFYRIYTSWMLLNLVLGLGASKSIKEATRKAKELLESENHGGKKGKYYRTSASVLALFGDSQSPLARKFLQKSASLYAKVPGNGVYLCFHTFLSFSFFGFV
jgi:hypothetical protein